MFLLSFQQGIAGACSHQHGDAATQRGGLGVFAVGHATEGEISIGVDIIAQQAFLVVAAAGAVVFSTEKAFLRGNLRSSAQNDGGGEQEREC